MLCPERFKPSFVGLENFDIIPQWDFTGFSLKRWFTNRDIPFTTVNITFVNLQH